MLLDDPSAIGALLSKTRGRLLIAMAPWKKHGRLFAIGDIHGCPDELGALLKAIDLGSGDTAHFRRATTSTAGPRRKDVIDILIELKRQPLRAACFSRATTRT